MLNKDYKKDLKRENMETLMKFKFSFFVSCFIFATQIITIHAMSEDVIPSIGLCPQEISFIETRKQLCHKAIEVFTGNQCKTTPNIAICLSGGGYRAMISGLGFLLGAQKTGLLDASQYITSLSGSTWLIGPLLANNNLTTSHLDYLEAYREDLKQTVSLPFLSKPRGNLAAIRNMLTQKHSQGQPLQFVDVWGAMIATNLLGTLAEHGQNVYLSQCTSPPAAFPFPIFSAVTGDSAPYEWLEVSPFNVECDYLKAQISLAAFGNRCDGDVMVTHWPEQRLGYFLGMFGSSYATDLGDIFHAIAVDVENPILRKILMQISLWRVFQIGRIAPATPPNYTFDLKPAISPTEHKKDMTIIDGGFAFNLPIPPLLKPQRQIDIIIICDASSDSAVDFGPELLLVEEYARTHGSKFPPIDHPYFQNDTMTIFKTDDPTIPTVVYFPNKQPFSTLKLQYSPDEFEALCSYMENAVSENRGTIYDVIYEKTK